MAKLLQGMTYKGRYVRERAGTAQAGRGSLFQGFSTVWICWVARILWEILCLLASGCDVGPALAGKAAFQTINIAWMYWPLPG
ncbi:hypothetical protein IV01_08090 [Pseudomonas syringae]|uniref:Uncharacterized protein n=1 Tax=Pseudomonas syringae TaxID=317 RepID=A0A085VMG4_PSESX|nr:hypothetical protein IV01_08090 [Pseudomonas syringae]